MKSPATLHEFYRRFPTERRCWQALGRMRWPDGFRCPRCEGCKAHRLRARGLWQCAACRYQASLTAGTPFHGTRVPLRTWFLAMFFMGRHKQGISALQFQRDAGELILVEEGPDAADDWIVANVRAGDVVVTADIPLAARCLAAGARVLGTNGPLFSDESIRDLLATRDLKAQLRGASVMSGGPPPMSEKDRSRFLSKLDELVRLGMREQRSA